MSERTTAFYLTDILDSIKRIEKYTRTLSPEKFRNDEKTIDAVVRNFEIIGEAARHVPKAMRIQYPAIPWKQVVGARDKMIHEYFGVDLDVLWKTIFEDFPSFKQQVKDLLQNLH